MPHVQTENKVKTKKKKSKTKNSSGSVSDNSASEASGIKLPGNTNDNAFIKEVEVTAANKSQQSQAKVIKKPTENRSNDYKKNVSADRTDGNADGDSSELLSLTLEGNIQLKNLPEITVTKTAVAKPEAKPSEEPADKSVEEKNSDKLPAPKKKKKKKKKKAGEEKENKKSDENDTSTAPESSASEPTYVKLPNAGGSCVLVVSHESFGGNNNKNLLQQNEDAGGSRSNSVQIIQSPPVTLNALGNPPVLPEVEISTVEKKNCPAVLLTAASQEIEKSNGALPAAEPKGKGQKKIATQTSGKDKSKLEKQTPQDGEKIVKKETTKSQEETKGKSAKGKIPAKDKKSSQVRTFSHLPPYKPLSLVYKHLESKSGVHPAIVTVGTQCAEGIISGPNACCVAVLAALKEMIKDYQTPLNKELSRDLESQIQECVNFIAKCRPLSVSTLNAVKTIRHQVNNIPPNISDDEAKNILNDHIHKFVEKEICLSKKKICSYVKDMIADGDVILIYAYSSVVKDAICEAHEQKRFRVIVIDSRPKMNGWKMLKCLSEKNIECSYALINGISYLMSQVTKVIIGAHVLQANGSILSHVGSSQIALIASHYNVPFVVCCETYKLSEKVYADSFSFNELGDPDIFLRQNSSTVETLKDGDKLHLLNILYDLTASHLVSVVITEKGTLPCRV